MPPIVCVSVYSLCLRAARDALPSRMEESRRAWRLLCLSSATLFLMSADMCVEKSPNWTFNLAPLGSRPRPTAGQACGVACLVRAFTCGCRRRSGLAVFVQGQISFACQGFSRKGPSPPPLLYKCALKSSKGVNASVVLAPPLKTTYFFAFLTNQVLFSVHGFQRRNNWLVSRVLFFPLAEQIDCARLQS